jgi:aldose 1-epimerase
VTVAPFGTMPDGTAVQAYTLSNDQGVRAVVTSYGATLVQLHLPDRRGVTADIVLGYDTLEEYRAGRHYLGATVGRVANRIRNGAFALDGETYRLTPNETPHHLHGGAVGFDKVAWHPEALPGAGAVRLTHRSPDGDEGYPGTVTVSQLISLSDDNELSFGYTASTEAPTLVNLTNHPYFNLAGSGSVLDQQLTIHADSYTPTSGSLPTGEIAPVRGTPYDFTASRAIGARMSEVDRGYDHNFVIRGEPGRLRPAARASHPASGRYLDLSTTLPAVQLYTGNFLDGRGKAGMPHEAHTGFTLETQGYPDAPNQPGFPSIVLRPGETWRHNTVLKVGVV